MNYDLLIAVYQIMIIDTAKKGFTVVYPNWQLCLSINGHPRECEEIGNIIPSVCAHSKTATKPQVF